MLRFLVPLSVLAHGAFADDFAKADAFIGVFYRMCLNDGFRDHLMVALAEGEKWKLVPDSLTAQLFQITDGMKAHAWVVDIPEEAPQFIGFSAKNLPEKTPAFEICGAMFYGVDGDYFVDALKADAQAVVVSERPNQDGKVWEVTVPDLKNATLDIAWWPKAATGDGGTMASVTFWGDGKP